MMPRRRNRKNNDLPQNLYITRRKSGKAYFWYKRINPETGTVDRVGIGYDRNMAREFAIMMNQKFTVSYKLQQKAKLEHRLQQIEQRDSGFKEIEFRTFTEGPFMEYLKSKCNQKTGVPYSPRTIKGYELHIRYFNRQWGNRLAHTIQWHEIDDYLQALTSKNVRTKSFNHLNAIFKYLRAKRYITENPLDHIEKLPEDFGSEKRKRLRLTIEQYDKIFQAAERPFQLVLEMALNILIRRGDIRTLRFDMIDDEQHLCLPIKKTSVPLRIPLALPLAHSNLNCRTFGDLINLCRDDFACPYILHRRPKKLVKGRSKDHMFQWGQDELSKKFFAARKQSGILEEIGRDDSPPTFHECISLGQALRDDQGWKEDDIKALRGHSKLSTTLMYLDDQPAYRTFNIPDIQS